MQRWLKRYGFALLVFVALACASFLAGSAAVPEPVPDYALQSKEIYRLEVGAASFVAFYLATMALVLALDGRGFAEFGTRGLKAEDVVDRTRRAKQQEAWSCQVDSFRRTEKRLDNLEASIKLVQKRTGPEEAPLESSNQSR